MIKAISVFRLIKDIQKDGNEVTYFSCDVRDAQMLEGVLKEAAAKYGPVNVIIHGAGVEKSRLLSQKSKEEFEAVFEVKANGLCNIYRLAYNNALKVVVGFSSISGRFGNEAQLDYCSANSFISGFMSAIKTQKRDLRAVSISWSGWKDTGMAWRNEYIKENSKVMGLHLIEPDRGTEEFLKILLSDINLDEIIVSKGLTPFTGPEKWIGIKNTTPLIDWISKRDGKIEKLYKVLSVKTDPIINHHRLGKTPLMPAVGFLEVAAQVHSLVYGKSDRYCFSDMRFDNALKLFHDKPQEILIKPTKAFDDTVDIKFYNYFIPKFGEGKIIPLNNMKVSGKIGNYESLKELKNFDTTNMIEKKLNHTLQQFNNEHKNSIRLGSLFIDENCEKMNLFRYNEERIIYSLVMSEDQINNKKYALDSLLINPAFADSVMQTCAIHASYIADGIYLPWKVEEFGVVHTSKESGSYTSYGKLIKSNEDERVYNVILYNDREEVCYYEKSITVKRIAQ